MNMIYRISYAYEITKTEGIAAVNARSIAKRLKCSTHPVFRVYENMESLKEDIVKRAEKHYNTRMMSGLEHPVPFLGMGIAYIQFAKEEKQLFKQYADFNRTGQTGVFEYLALNARHGYNDRYE
ncbi:MAG: hypothetical protein ACRC3H_21265 [Lachnospiraceae bacterium]